MFKYTQFTRHSQSQSFPEIPFSKHLKSYHSILGEIMLQRRFTEIIKDERMNPVMGNWFVHLNQRLRKDIMVLAMSKSS